MSYQVNVIDIQSLEEAYRDSEEERDDLQQTYLDFEGDMDRILEVMLCARIEDEPRFRKYLDMSVRAGDLPDYPAFSSQSKQKRESQKGKVVRMIKSCVKQPELQKGFCLLGASTFAI